MYKFSTSENPFKLIFGVEAIIPIKIRLPYFRVTHYDNDVNEEQIRVSLDLIEKV